MGRKGPINKWKIRKKVIETQTNIEEWEENNNRIKEDKSLENEVAPLMKSHKSYGQVTT